MAQNAFPGGNGLVQGTRPHAAQVALLGFLSQGVPLPQFLEEYLRLFGHLAQGRFGVVDQGWGQQQTRHPRQPLRDPLLAPRAPSRSRSALTNPAAYSRSCSAVVPWAGEKRSGGPSPER